jgi:hypothetical protein
MQEYYVYQYVREDGTPYYVGKGKGRRAFADHRWVPVPRDRNRIQFIAEYLSEDEAFEIEIATIAHHGRKIDGGILLNLSIGGGGTGITLSDKHKQKISEANKGKTVLPKSRSSLEGHILRYGEVEGKRLYAEHCAKKDSMSLSAFIKRYGEIAGPIKYNERQLWMSERMAGENHPLFGIGHTNETKQKISESKTGKKIKRTAEHNAKIGAANRGKKPPLDTCIHCGMITSVTNIKRWHNDNCKRK